uniref:Uncharacterized protein n=1 Tax=Arundo donax TaxID=35708 RepID=A0A0A9GER4_ARUDO
MLPACPDDKYCYLQDLVITRLSSPPLPLQSRRFLMVKLGHMILLFAMRSCTERDSSFSCCFWRFCRLCEAGDA